MRRDQAEAQTPHCGGHSQWGCRTCATLDSDRPRLQSGAYGEGLKITPALVFVVTLFGHDSRQYVLLKLAYVLWGDGVCISNAEHYFQMFLRYRHVNLVGTFILLFLAAFALFSNRYPPLIPVSSTIEHLISQRLSKIDFQPGRGRMQSQEL